jgi:hypothetical protein
MDKSSRRRPENGPGNAASRDIRDFFAPKPAPRAPTPASPKASRSKSPAFSPSPATPEPPSSPPIPSEAAGFAPDRIIAASDDEDGESDGLPDLATILGTRSPAQRTEATSCVTPQAKRTALEFHSSPLASRPKPHQFDMRALIKHAKKDDATEESSKLVATLDADQADDDRDPYVNTDESVRKPIVSFSTIGGDGKMTKVMRAMERTEATSSRRTWYFFDAHPGPGTVASPRKFPKAAAKGPWQFLADGESARDQHIIWSSMPMCLLEMKRKLPDELFLWILDEAYLAESNDFRQACTRLVDLCSEQVRRLISPIVLQVMFENLGASEHITTLKDIESTRRLQMLAEIGDAYVGRDWSKLQAFFILTAKIARCLTLESRSYAVRALVRMGVDRTLSRNIAVLRDRNHALECLASAIPSIEWNELVSSII